MNEQEALWRVVGVIIVIAVWGYANFSMDPIIVKARDTTQKWVNMECNHQFPPNQNIHYKR
jgi:hypothetical protein